MLLTTLGELDDDLPVMLEHLNSPTDYANAATDIRAMGEELGIEI